MKYINFVELRGCVGMSRTTKVGNVTLIHFSLATNLALHSQDGSPVIETSWHNVQWATTEDVSRITKGAKVHVLGRIRHMQYTASSGEQRTTCCVIAQSLKVLPDEEFIDIPNEWDYNNDDC